MLDKTLIETYGYDPLKFHSSDYIHSYYPKMTEEEFYQGVCQKKPLTIKYSFSLIQTDLLKINNILTKYNDNSEYISFNELRIKDKELTLDAFKQYEKIANVKFIENTTRPHLHIFNFQLNSLSSDQSCSMYNTDHFLKGMAINFYKYRYLIFNDVYFKSCDLYKNIPRKQKTIFHEIGHGAFGLEHGFDMGYLMEHQIYTSYSVMNYDHEFDYATNRTIYPITPMPADFIALQQWLGNNPLHNIGDSLYDLADYVPKSFQQYSTIAAIYDLDGIDTIKTTNINASFVTINLQPYSRSSLEYGYVLLAGTMENLQTGKHNCSITLNSANNIVDLRLASTSSIMTNPNHCGSDVIVGFKKTDTILFKNILSTHFPDCKLILYKQCADVVFAGEFIPCQNKTSIVFDGNNRIDFINSQLTIPETLNGFSCTNVNYSSSEEVLSQDLIHKVVTQFSKDLTSNFLNSLLHGSLIGYAMNLTRQELKKQQYSEQQIAILMIALQSIIIYSSGSYFSSGTALLISSLCNYIGFTNENASTAGLIASEIASDLSFSGVIKAPVKSAGAYLGTQIGQQLSQFGFWASAKKVYNYLAEEPADNKYQLPI